MQRQEDAVAVYLDASATGVLTSSAPVLQGTYRVGFSTDAAFTLLPQGQVTLGEVTVGGPTSVTKAFDMTGTEIVVELRRQGGPLESLPGGDRGMLMATSTAVHGEMLVGAATASARIPAAGPSEVKLRLFKGVWALYYYCETMCANPSKQFAVLVSGVRLP